MSEYPSKPDDKSTTVSRGSFPWVRAPREISDMIFSYVNNSTRTERGRRWNGRAVAYFTWDGRMPPAVVAFRRFPAVHESTLRFFMMVNHGRIKVTLGGAGLTLITTHEAKLVKSLEFTATDTYSLPKDLTRPFERYENLQAVMLMPQT